MVVAKTHPGRPVGVLLGPAHSLGQDGGGAVEMPDLEMLGVLHAAIPGWRTPRTPGSAGRGGGRPSSRTEVALEGRSGTALTQGAEQGDDPAVADAFGVGVAAVGNDDGVGVARASRTSRPA